MEQDNLPSGFQNNIDALEQYELELMQQHMGSLDLLSGTGILQPIGDESQSRFDSLSSSIKDEINSLPTKIDSIKELVERFNFETPIDGVFVDGLLQILSYPDIDSIDMDTRFLEAAENLELRIASNAVEREFETRKDISISGDRNIMFVLNPDKSKINMVLPLVTDPSEFPVALGINAVNEILGGQLTDEDYKLIHDSLLSLPGKVGEVLNNYKTAVANYLNAYSNRSDEINELIRIRAIAANELNAIFDFSMHTDIPLNAIFTTAARTLNIPNFTSPQPYIN